MAVLRPFGTHTKRKLAMIMCLILSGCLGMILARVVVGAEKRQTSQNTTPVLDLKDLQVSGAGGPTKTIDKIPDKTDGITLYYPVQSSGSITIKADLTLSGTPPAGTMKWTNATPSQNNQLIATVAQTTAASTQVTCQCGNGTQLTVTIVVCQQIQAAFSVAATDTKGKVLTSLSTGPAGAGGTSYAGNAITLVAPVGTTVTWPDKSSDAVPLTLSGPTIWVSANNANGAVATATLTGITVTKVTWHALSANTTIVGTVPNVTVTATAGNTGGAPAGTWQSAPFPFTYTDSFLLGSITVTLNATAVVSVQSY